MMLTVYRDVGFFLLALIIYDVLLYKGVMYYYEACLIMSLIVLYALSIIAINRYSHHIESKAKKGLHIKMQEGVIM